MTRSISGVALAAAALASADCASTPDPPTPVADSRTFVVEGRTTRGEESVLACAGSFVQTPWPSVVSAAAADTSRANAYDPASVSNAVYYRTGRSGRLTVLTVFASSYAYTVSGSDPAARTSVQIQATAAARERARLLVAACAGPA